MKKSRIRALMTALVVPVFLFCCTKGAEVPERLNSSVDLSSGIQSKKELEEIKKNIKSDIRIKLKKDGKGGYGWEITGRDPHEVVKANNIMRSRVSDEKRE